MIINPIIPIWIMLIICIALACLKTGSKMQFIKKIIICLLLFLINLRIMIVKPGTAQKISNDLNVIFVIDNTLSMQAEDYNGSKKRMEGVKKDCEYIIEKLRWRKNFCNSFQQ